MEFKWFLQKNQRTPYNNKQVLSRNHMSTRNKFTYHRENTLKGYTNYNNIKVNANRPSGRISIFLKASYPSILQEIIINTPLEI